MLDNSAGFLRLQEGVSRKLEENLERGRKVKEHKAEYTKLDTRLSSIADDLSHEVMVPLTKKAFMPGHLVHTNEIMVLLGENYFLETSAKKAKEICARRLNECDKLLLELQEELKLVEGWKNQTSKLGAESAECREIIEESTEEELEAWRKKHQESVRREKEREKSQQVKQKQKLHLPEQKAEVTDEELWARLEELEVREALEKEWEQEEEEEEDYDDDETSGDDDDDDDEDDGYGAADDEEIRQRLVKINSKEDLEFLDGEKRRVSFGTITHQSTDVPEIRFQHSSSKSVSPSETPNSPAHPGDLVNLVLPGHTPYKSILKLPSDFNPDDYVRTELPEHEAPRREAHSVIDEPFHNPVNPVVQERPTISEITPAEPAKKVSRFKAMRAVQN